MLQLQRPGSRMSWNAAGRFSFVRPVRPIVVVEALPHRKFLLEIHIILVRQELVELVFVGSMGALDLAIELWRPWFDVDSSMPLSATCQ